MARERDTELTFEIIEHIAVLSVGRKGWKKELCIVKWGENGEPRYDIRSWNEDYTKMSKGITLSGEELKALVAAVQTKL